MRTVTILPTDKPIVLDYYMDADADLHTHSQSNRKLAYIIPIILRVV